MPERVSGATPSMAMWECRRVSMALDSTTPCECVYHRQIGRPVHGVQPEKSGLRRRQDALDLALDVVLRRELGHALDGEPGAVARHADLRRPVEDAFALEEPSRRARGARIGLHRVLRVRLPVAEEPLGAE